MLNATQRTISDFHWAENIVGKEKMLATDILSMFSKAFFITVMNIKDHVINELKDNPVFLRPSGWYETFNFLLRGKILDLSKFKALAGQLKCDSHHEVCFVMCKKHYAKRQYTIMFSFSQTV